MAPLAPDPQALYDAGKKVVDASGVLNGALAALVGQLGGSSGMCGDDPSGVEVAHAYNEAAKALVLAVVDTINGSARIGDGCQASAANYANANHASSMGPSTASPLEFPAPTAPKSSRLPPSAEGGQGTPGWLKAIESLIGMLVPNGKPEQMRAAAGVWKQMAEACHTAAAALSGPKDVAADQRIPEAEKMGAAFTTAISSLEAAGTQCSSIAGKLETYAAHVQDVQDKIHDLASKLGNPESLLHAGWDWLHGRKAEVQRIIDDIKAIVNNFKAEASSVAHLLAPLVAEAEAFGKQMLAYADMAVQQVENLAYNVAAETVNTAATWAYAAATHPGDVLMVAGGLALADLGVGGEVGGVALDATGVGAVVGVPANVVSAGAIATGVTAAGAGIADLGQAADKHQVTVMEYRGQPRTPDGKFAGGSGYGKDAEAKGLADYQEENPGRPLTTDKRAIQVTGKDGQPVNTYPDGLAKKPDGTYEAVEVKSGSASLTPNQQALRDQIARGEPVYATVVEGGEAKTVQVTSFRRMDVASEGPGH
ncbi:conserved hypothetical protein [Segniliparus rotundus DSM 44985]|uniref:Uncharacterized protein n=1 Tax=Segniliparus rotundus (strain ATCC BAA-972 / CDC 1076 / CIP 108378 / DSM 44985 / JCM 13578) TaxID=640132 RepID=D6ZF50_SEGRD|nr:hypothetical protein [Segniliparus rotundus]ADG97574.1 conserved hypothetical protein [Segniliparus rotundus DSM 44985]